MVKTVNRSKFEDEQIVVDFRLVDGSVPEQPHYCLTIQVHAHLPLMVISCRVGKEGMIL